MRLVLLGPPGVGKGTQGRRLAAEHHWALISTGEILRDAVARKTSLGLEAQRCMEKGMLVPDDMMIGLVRDRSNEADADGRFVLDGFPRTVAQADALDSMLQSRGHRLDAVIGLEAPKEELVKRLSARRECPVCQRAYNRASAPPRDGRHCDDHPSVDLVQREDDAEATVRKRLEVYEKQTSPLLEYYRGQGRLREVKGLGSVDEVYRQLNRALGC
ncbi:MAG: adenylate kinase [Candidatus Eisenbacteria bacterium]|uniref:Adenylate kinase n=1 Tax=Eiseniibacteriota bacterium TaxID=2212470 RepID=A0A538TXB8_UNCEI|nr:MAG: adenylate kinase [Candidatus Eisenbacteria bacterium]